ncbi:hypothetical protein GW17_00049965 [Ensete ventricosum]|uniref:Uncharacterized protein n=1 Tax=Ensete ventricosum TaxID=4639 RepID=A0A444CQ28_ENSVE|nr:hypothetical protein B296_00020319 [Ensete ventricosum]RWV87994.1 hypothetical protein GW17_00049965 [Ensete ventricosum]RZR73105.1 hypothetical protein BHM03_00020182 [Ensete ventricosum]
MTLESRNGKKSDTYKVSGAVGSMNNEVRHVSDEEVAGEAVAAAAAALLEAIIAEGLEVGLCCTKEVHAFFGTVCEANCVCSNDHNDGAQRPV